MINVRRILVLCAVLASAVTTSVAQPRFSSTTVARPGQERTYINIDSTNVRPGSSGPNAEWFFTSPRPGIGTSQSMTLPPSRLTTSVQQRFPSTQFAITLDTTTSLYALSNGLYRCIGIITPRTLTAFFADEGSHDSRPVEFTSGQTYRDAFRGSFTTTGVPGTGIRSGSVMTHYDAYGTLQIGSVLFRNVMRLRTTTVMQDSVRVGAQSLIARTSTSSVAWYEANHGLPILDLRTDSSRSFRGTTPLGPTSVRWHYYVADTTDGVTSVYEPPTSAPHGRGLEVRPGQRIPLYDVPLGAYGAAVIDMTGRTVARLTLDITQVTVPQLSPGFYVIVVEGLSTTTSVPILVSH